MYQLTDCKLTEREATRLTTLFVAEEAPYYFESANAEMTQSLLHAGLLVYSRREFHENFPEFPLRYGYVYHVWSVEGDQILLADERRLCLLDESLRQTLLQKQVQAGRGHVYREDWLRALAGEFPPMQREEIEGLLTQHGFVHAGQRVLLLTHEMWGTLSFPIQLAWVLKWFTEQLNDDQGEAIDISPADMQVRPEVADLALEYAGRLPSTVAANCFAAALGLAIGTREAAEVVMQRWLHEGPFFRSLRAIGYEKCGEHRLHDNSFVLRGEDVLVWLNNAGSPIHAAYVLAPDLLFQKMGQSWVQIFRFVRYASVLDYADVLTKGGHVDVYRLASHL